MRAVCMSGQPLNPSASSGHDLVLPVGELGVPLCWARTDAFPSVSSRICVYCITMCVRPVCPHGFSFFVCFGFTNYLPSSLLTLGPLYARCQGS